MPIVIDASAQAVVLQDQLVKSVQAHLDAKAKTRGYDNIISASSYAGYANPFQAEGQVFLKWRGDVWAYCYRELAKVSAGTRIAPTESQLIAELPILIL